MIGVKNHSSGYRARNSFFFAGACLLVVIVFLTISHAITSSGSTGVKQSPRLVGTR